MIAEKLGICLAYIVGNSLKKKSRENEPEKTVVKQQYIFQVRGGNCRARRLSGWFAGFRSTPAIEIRRFQQRRRRGTGRTGGFPMDLYDLMRQAQGGNSFTTLGQQFGLGPDQMQQAVEALMPAFASGLQRNTTDPMGMLKFMQALSSGQHADYYDNPANAFSPAGRAEGEAILGHLFGSKDVSRALADQAFQATGIGQSILK
ncbi:MAG: DUF937 domain-containing protein, partial [Alphaproteobacteria bacterium]